VPGPALRPRRTLHASNLALSLAGVDLTTPGAGLRAERLEPLEDSADLAGVKADPSGELLLEAYRLQVSSPGVGFPGERRLNAPDVSPSDVLRRGAAAESEGELELIAE
jgi:hypothetical protein